METHILFFVAAVAAGLINSMAGGGGLITFPLLALVVPPVVADATSAFALLPAYPSAVWRTRGKLSEVSRRWLWLLLIPSVLGGLAGALLLVWTGDRNFTFLVPWLVLGGTVLFVLEPRLSRRSGVAPGNRGLTKAMWPLATAVVFVVAIYGGYFGAGIGILMLAALGLLGFTDIYRMNALKNLLAICINGVAAVYFIASGKVYWTDVLVMTFAAIAGGYSGARLAYRLGRRFVRLAVILIGLVMSVSLFIK
ncbi:MAG: sulfite exporter TauE/SafE family protein [Rubrobacteraceae bacterium]